MLPAQLPAVGYDPLEMAQWAILDSVNVLHDEGALEI